MHRILISPYFIWLAIIAVFFVHALATIFFGYWKLPWLDILLHFSGGVVAASVFLYFANRQRLLFNFISVYWLTILITVSFVALVGVGWEFFEFILDSVFKTRGTLWQLQGGLQDTLGDLLTDLIGGAVLVTAFIFSKKNDVGEVIQSSNKTDLR
ncbi:MAG: hypothetical protein AAB885_00515 [Patescibacteria group bacterium]